MFGFVFSPQAGDARLCGALVRGRGLCFKMRASRLRILGCLAEGVEKSSGYLDGTPKPQKSR